MVRESKMALRKVTAKSLILLRRSAAKYLCAQSATECAKAQHSQGFEFCAECVRKVPPLRGKRASPRAHPHWVLGPRSLSVEATGAHDMQWACGIPQRRFGGFQS